MTLRKKHGYSQQEIADRLSVTRQTISNWECNQGSPTLDKAMQLAKIYGVSLDDLAEYNVEIIAKEKKAKDYHVLEKFIGKKVKLDFEFIGDGAIDFGSDGKVKILDVTDEWLKIEYNRTKENSLFKKENVIELIDILAVNGIEVVEERL